MGTSPRHILKTLDDSLPTLNSLRSSSAFANDLYEAVSFRIDLLSFTSTP